MTVSQLLNVYLDLRSARAAALTQIGKGKTAFVGRENKKTSRKWLVFADGYICELWFASRNGASFAVALNCGIGSSSLKADVKAFARLHCVRGAKSSICGSK